MSDSNYPEDMARFNNDPRSPNYDDPTEGSVFEETKEFLTRERIQDTGGYFLDSFTEAPFNRLEELIDAILLPADEKSSIRIGNIVRDLVEGYCTPTDEQVLEELER